MAASNNQSMIDFWKNSSFLTVDDAKTGSSFEESVINKPSYIFEYEKERVMQLERRLVEKDKIINDISHVHDETYENNMYLEKKLLESNKEREELYKEIDSLKGLLKEKIIKIEILEQTVMRNAKTKKLDLKTKFENKFESFTHEKDKFVILRELNDLREKYNDREELIISLQNDKATLQRQLDDLKRDSRIDYQNKSKDIETLNHVYETSHEW